MPGLLTYWNTIRHLKPIQVYGRVRAAVQPARVDARPAPPPRPRSGAWVPAIERTARMLGPERFVFLNEEFALAGHDWDVPGTSKLWRYNLHYFDDLNAADADARTGWHTGILRRWIRENPPGARTAWDAYPTSLRIVNWVKWALRGHVLPTDIADSLALQTRWLADRLEIQYLGNHLFANAKALVFAGAYFSGAEAEAWLRRATGLLRTEIPEQILPDGGQFERSPMYHALALEDMLDLCNVARAYAVACPALAREATEVWAPRVPAMQAWLSAMCHPDGEIAFFNDAAMDIAPTPRQLDEYGERLGFPRVPARAGLTVLQPSGYVRVERDGAVALLDVGEIGPDYLPGHAHADTLSLELSLSGHRVIVNTGTSRYGVSEERVRERGTPAHSTVVVDGRDSSEVWSGFRVGRRARPSGFHAGAAGDVITVRCGHDGYRALPGRVHHERTWRFAANAMVVEDVLSGRFRSAQARFHLHPGVQVAERASGGDETLRVVLPGGGEMQVRGEGAALRVEASVWHRGFGLSAPARCIVLEFGGPRVAAHFSWDARAHPAS